MRWRGRVLEVRLIDPGLLTAIAAVLLVPVSEAGTFACNCELLTNVVGTDDPFQRICAPDANPAPSTVMENPVVAGAKDKGAAGVMRNGTPLLAGLELIVEIVRRLLWVMPFRLAVIVAVDMTLTAEVEIENVALSAPGGTTAVAGT